MKADQDYKHYLPESIFQGEVTIHIIGCGGTGSHLVPRLPLLHKSMLALGHPAGLNVTVWDGDVVSESNTVRQNFFSADIGQNKASIMINRINACYGLNWKAKPRQFGSKSLTEGVGYLDRPNFLIGCVDSKAARRQIAAYMDTARSSCYYIDSGNSADSGQIIVGQGMDAVVDTAKQLPPVSALYPELFEGEDDGDQPSCSARESLARQGLATNAMCAAWVMTWLSEAFRHGYAEWQALFFNLRTGASASVPVSPALWDTVRPPLQEAA